MKHICLIIPPSPFLLDERVFVSLGILKVAAVLKKAGHKVDVLDLSGIQNYLDVLDDYDFNPIDYIGLTATTPQMPYVMEITSHFFENYGDFKTILGGPHVSLMNAAKKVENKKGNFFGRAERNMALLSSLFYSLLCGDGEKAIFEALKGKRLVDADDRKSELFLSDQEFSDLPLPARHLIDMDSYRYNLEGVKATSMIAQLGCPFECTFCGGRNSPFLRKIRLRTPKDVVQEIEFLYKEYGYTGIMFYDDELNVNRQMIPLLNQICDLSDKLGVDFKLRGFVKAELFNEDQAEAMYRAGFRWILTGFESGDSRILTNINKKATVDDNTRCIEIAKKHDLKVKALMSIGHAGESLESIRNTRNWLLATAPEEFDVTVITPYPGSPYFDEAEKKKGHYVYTSPFTGDKLYQDDVNYFSDSDFYKGDPNDGYISHVWTDHLSAEALVIERDMLEDEVREVLKIPYNPSNSAIKYEHSMGQSNTLPKYILRSSNE
jgi:radical SAM superfamily enzyme YgiQ (UPF0313 family)